MSNARYYRRRLPVSSPVGMRLRETFAVLSHFIEKGVADCEAKTEALKLLRSSWLHADLALEVHGTAGIDQTVVPLSDFLKANHPELAAKVQEAIDKQRDGTR